MSTEPAWQQRVSVIIPARNVATTLGAQLEALSRQSFHGWWEVIVVDNGSSDGTADIARAWRADLPNLRVVDAPVARGAGGARNVGSRVAEGELLLFCDADDTANPGWVEAMAAAARTSDLVGGYLEQELLNTRRVRSWRDQELRHRLPTGVLGYLPYAPTACLGVRAEVFRSLGGFNEDYAGACEDVEFCWRAQLASYVISFAADAVMHYRHRDRLWPSVKQSYGYGRDNAQLMRDFRPHGLPAVSVLQGAKGWCRQLRRLPHLASRDRAGFWWFLAAWRAGRLVGSIRYRVPCL